MKKVLIVILALWLVGCANTGVGVSGGSSGISSISIGTGVRR